MKRYILTGTPGCGKTSIIKALEKQGYVTISEAATDIITKEQALGHKAPWTHPEFIDMIVRLQKTRQQEADSKGEALQFYDRSPICTYALCLYLGFTPSRTLLDEIERIQKEAIYQKQVFFLENLGFITPTEARKISFQDSLAFEKVHQQAYTKWGYECLVIPALPIEERLQKILSQESKKLSP